MSDTHKKTVIVRLDGYAETKSKGGTVVAVFELLKTYLDGIDVNGDYAVPSPLVPYVENYEGTDSQRKTLKSEYKMIQLEDDHADVNNVQIGWILDSDTGTTLSSAG